MVIAADVARNLGSLSSVFDAKQIILLSFFGFDASILFAIAKILDGAEVLRECVTRKEYWNAKERPPNCSSIIGIGGDVLRNYGLLFVHRNGWSVQINHVIRQPTDYTFKLGEVRRVIVRGP